MPIHKDIKAYNAAQAPGSDFGVAVRTDSPRGTAVPGHSTATDGVNDGGFFEGASAMGAEAR